MKLNILIAALKHYALSADCPEEDRDEVFAALASCTRTEERYEYNDLWHDSCYVLAADTLDDLLNIATYDWYGRLQKKYGEHRLPFYMYAAECRKYIDNITDEQLELGYDVISDLWHDNETDGSHNEDGTFRHDD